MKRFFAVIPLLVALMVALLAPPAQAAPPFGAFASIRDMELMVGGKIKTLDFDGALAVIDPAGRSLSVEQKDRFVNSLSGYFLHPMTQEALLKEEILGGGFRRAIYAYWRDDLPVYLYVVTHSREDAVWLLQYNIDTSFSKIIGQF